MTGEDRGVGVVRSSVALPPSRAAVEPALLGRAPYEAPRLEALGAWTALTLQQSVPIGPGGFLFDPGRIDRLG